MSSRPPAPFADPATAALLERAGIDPDDGLQVIGIEKLAARPFDPGVALLILPRGGAARSTSAADAPRRASASDPDGPDTLPGRHGHGHDPAVLLRRLYPHAHPVFGPDRVVSVAEVDAASLAQAAHALPRLEELHNVASPFGLPWLVDRLRRPDGCPWDREQDHLTLRPFLLEETYEVYDALEGGDTPELAEELGDLLLQIVLHAQYAAEAGAFDLADVQRGIMTKIIRRHPHVFGDVEARTAGDVIRNWEQLKAGERAAAGGRATAGGRAAATGEGFDMPSRPGDPDMPAAFAGLSKSLPALSYADEMQARAAGLGYDWPDLEGVIDKVAEEATELLAATDDVQRREEFGDLLFVIVNMGRKLGIDAEAALRSASRKFASRFARVERLADARGLQLKALGLDELDELWQEAKRDESRDASAPGEEGR